MCIVTWELDVYSAWMRLDIYQASTNSNTIESEVPNSTMPLNSSNQ